MIDALGISQAEVVRLRLALEWYADARNWEWQANGERNEPPPANNDRGRRATEALQFKSFMGER